MFISAVNNVVLKLVYMQNLLRLQEGRNNLNGLFLIYLAEGKTGEREILKN